MKHLLKFNESQEYNYLVGVPSGEIIDIPSEILQHLLKGEANIQLKKEGNYYYFEDSQRRNLLIYIEYVKKSLNLPNNYEEIFNKNVGPRIFHENDYVLYTKKGSKHNKKEGVFIEEREDGKCVILFNDGTKLSATKDNIRHWIRKK